MPGLVFQRKPESLQALKLQPGSFHKLLLLNLHGAVITMPELSDVNKEVSLVELHPGVRELLSFYRNAGWFIGGLANEGGIGLKTVNHGDVQKVLARTQELAHNTFDAFVYCPHNPEAIEAENSRCMCHIPSYGLIVQMRFMLTHIFQVEFPAHKIKYIGATEDDRRCAQRANVEFKAAEDWRNEIIALDSKTLLKPWMRG